MQGQMLQNMVAMKEMLNLGDNQKSPISDLRDMMALVEDLRGEKKDDEPKGVMDVLGGLMDKALPALTQAAKQDDPGTPVNAQKRNPKNPRPKKENENMNLGLKMQLGFLCKMAAKNADPATYAGLVIDQASPEQLENLVKILESDDWINTFSNSNAEVLKHGEWLGEMRALILEEVFPEKYSSVIDTTQTPDDTTEELDNETTGNDVSATGKNEDENIS